MDIRYRIILSGNHVYKEAELTPDKKLVRLGTATECEFRLLKEDFFEPVELTFSQADGTWTVYCSDNLYLNVGDARKLFTLRLAHGSVFRVCYQQSSNEIFSVEFLIDFENEKKRISRQIDVRSAAAFGIGAGGENQIILTSRYAKNDALVLQQHGGALALTIRNTTYGVYLNGRRARTQELIRSGDFFSVCDAIFYYKDGFLWTEASDQILVNGLRCYDLSIAPDYPRFKRNSRVKVVPSEEKIEIMDPPAKPEKPKYDPQPRAIPAAQERQRHGREDSPP